LSRGFLPVSRLSASIVSSICRLSGAIV